MPSKKRFDSDGNPLLADSTRIAGQALQLVRLGLRWSQSTQRSTVLRSVNIYPPSSSRNGMWLCIAKGWAEGYKVVAFHRAPDLLTALLGLLSKIESETIEWKQDKFSDEA